MSTLLNEPIVVENAKGEVKWVGITNILWGTGGLERPDGIKAAFDVPITNLPDGTISTKRCFKRKCEASCFVETDRFITEYALESNDDGTQHLALDRIISMQEK